MSKALLCQMNLGGKSLHYTLRIVAGLIILLPLAITYMLLENGAFSSHPEYIYILFFSLIINLAALIIIGRIFGKFLNLASTMKQADAGEINHIRVDEETPELREISVSFNRLLERFTGTTDELQHRVFELLSMKELIETAAKSLDMELLLGSLLEKSMAVFNAGSGSVLLLEPDRKLFRVLNCCGDNSGIRKGSYISTEDALVRDVVANRKPLLVQNTDADSKHGDPETRSKSFLTIPILSGTEMIGILNIANRGDGRSFTEDDLSIMSIMISQIGFALENAKLHAGAKEHSRKLERQKDELKKYQNHLEELVQKRTQELEEAQEELIRKAKLSTLGQLTGTVSHELRNPLGTIRNSLQSLKSRIGDSGIDADHIIDRMDRNISRCDGIIDELLDYSRNRRPDLRPTLFTPWMEEVLSEYSLPKEIKLVTNLVSEIEIELDQELFRRVMINVMDNACQAMLLKQSSNAAVSGKIRQLSGVEPVIKITDQQPSQLTLSSQCSGARLLVSVTDNGPGISDADISKIFEPLFSTRTYGIGLGLPLVKQIMTQLNGGVDIETRHGQGTTVTLWLPASTPPI